MICQRPHSIPTERLEQFWYTMDEIPDFKRYLDYYENMNETPVIKRRGKTSIVNDFMCFDIETSTVPSGNAVNPHDFPIAFPYLFQVFLFGKVYLFRDREKVRMFFYLLSEELRKRDWALVCYDHNLSYEFQFMRDIVDIDADSIFAIKTRKIAKFSIFDGAIEFRCSYLLSNMSLEKFTENYCSEVFRKDKELIDYEIIRYPWTDLSDDIIYYSGMDVITLHAAVTSIMHKEVDTLKTIPMTNTGYVRRSLKEACIGTNQKHYRTEEEKKSYRKFYLYRKMFQKIRLTRETYDMHVRAFRGGNTHANRFYVGQILDTVGSYDFASSYPAVIICSNEFPMGKLEECTDELKTVSDIDYFASKYYLIMDICIRNCDLIDKKTTVPYLSKDKCLFKKKEKDAMRVFDNGRIITLEGDLYTTVTGWDWEIIRKQYKGQVKVIRAFYCLKGRLPKPIRETVLDWYAKKTQLKGVTGKEYEYMKSKNRVNSSYGCMVEKIIREIIELIDGELHARKPTEDEADEQLENFYTPMQCKFLAYQWGIAITAIARSRLQEMIDLCGSDFVYCDTDSVKMLHPEKYEQKFKEYNAKWIAYAKQTDTEISAFTPTGKEKILGIADKEDSYDRFCTLGAKKYAYDQNGHLGITVAGVPKVAGAELLGKLENFRPGFRFYVSDKGELQQRQAWKKRLAYNSTIDETLTIDGHDLRITSYVAMERTTYVLDITEEFADITKFYERYEQDDIY